MRRLFLSFHSRVADFAAGTTAIAAGLAILTAAMVWPGVPAVTAMALVALGATSETLRRFRGSASFLPIVLVHLATYGTLYALFVGAVLHASAQSGSGLSVTGIFDLFLSVCPLAMAFQQVWCEMHSSRFSE